MTASMSEAERAKYADIWSLPAYQQSRSPGAHWLDTFWDIAEPKPGARVLDVGAGSGAASRALKDKGLDVRAFDLTDAAWAHPDIELATGSLWRGLPNGAAKYDYGYCCDVMEHIPPQFTGLCIANILSACEHAFFSISFLSDHFGRYVGAPLHLTVQPFTWWLALLSELGDVIEARDTLGEGVFYVRSA